MLVTEIKKRQKLNTFDFIKYQLITYCFLNKINLSNADLDCLTLLVQKENVSLKPFCKDVVVKEIFKSEQTVRNCLNKIEDFNLIVKRGKHKKTVFINPALNVLFKGTLILDFKFLLDSNL